LSTTTEDSPQKKPPQPQRAFTINEWCARWGYSRPHFYALRRDGNAPEVIGTGKAQRISLEAEARWLKRQERLAKKGG
jgi:predicted DNA-binding transcriptional regulator AlpA